MLGSCVLWRKMIHISALRLLSFSGVVGIWQPRSFAIFTPRAPSFSLRLQTCRCSSEELSPKELHHLRKKKERKVLRKMKKEMLAKKRLEELAKLPVVKPNYAMARFESSKPIEGWNKPRKKRSAGTSRHNSEVIMSGSGEDSITEELSRSSTWSDLEAFYQDLMKSSLDGNHLYSNVDRNQAEASGSSESQEPHQAVQGIGIINASSNVSRTVSGSSCKNTDTADDNSNNWERDAFGSGDKIWEQRDCGRFSQEELDSFTGEIREEVERTVFRRTARVVVGKRNGDPVYLSTEDDDGKDRRRLRRDDMNERKQLEWLTKQLNSVGTRTDGVHFSRLMRSGGLKITEGRAVILLQLLGDRGNWRRAMQVVEWLTTRNQYPPTKSRYVFTTLLAVLGKTRRPNEALKVFKVMCEDTTIYPDMAAYHSIAVTLGQTGCLEDLLDLISTLRRGPKNNKYLLTLPNYGALDPDIFIFNAVLNACVSHKDWKCALWVLEEIRKEKLKPNSASYGLAIEVMVKAGKLNLAFETLEEMEASGCYPNSLTYKVLVEGLGRARKADAAVALVKRMEQRGMVPTPGVYFALATTLCMSGQWKKAILQIGRLIELSDRPLVETYTGLITACEKAGHWQDAISVFLYMREICAPNIGTYNVMIALYGRHDLFQEAKNLFDRLKLGRLSLRKIYKSDSRLSPDMYTYDAMLGACAVSGEWEVLESTYKAMLLQGYDLNSKRHTWILEALSKSGKHNLVEAMFTRLLKENEAVTSEVYRIISCSCIMVRRDEEAFSYLAEIVKQGMSISSKQLQQFQEVACSLPDEERAKFLNLLDQLEISSDFIFETSGKFVTSSDKSLSNNRITYQELQSSMITHERGRTSYRREGTTNRRDHGADARTTPVVRSDSRRVRKEESPEVFENTVTPAKLRKQRKVKKPIYRPDPVLPGWELLWTGADHVQQSR